MHPLNWAMFIQEYGKGKGKKGKGKGPLIESEEESDDSRDSSAHSVSDCMGIRIRGILL